MKISVLGAGAVGCMIAGLVKRYDPSIDLWLLGRGEHAERIRDTGVIKLQGECGDASVPASVCRHISDIAGSDLVLLTVKSNATDELMAAVKPYLGNAILVSLQNGINQKRLAQYLPARQFLVGITATNMSIDEPGAVTLHLVGPTILGPPDGSSEQESGDWVVSVLSKSRLPFKTYVPIESIQYNKISVNSLGYTSALSRSNFATECLLDRDWRRVIAIPMLKECFRVIDAAGIRLEHTPGPSDVIRLRLALNLLDRPVVRHPLAWLIRRRGNPRLVYSVEQDLLRGRPTEIDYVNGEIVRLANLHGVPAPLNQLTVDIAHELEERTENRFLSREQVIQRFRDSLQLHQTSPNRCHDD